MHPLEVDVQSVKARLDAGDDFLLVDCREATEHAKCRIEGARLVPMSQITERLSDLADYRERPIVVHCHHGGRSMRVTEWLLEQGFTDVKSMAGGIDVWSLQIDPSVPRY